MATGWCQGPPTRPPVLRRGDPADPVPGLQEGGRGHIRGVAPAAPGSQPADAEPGPRPAPGVRGDGERPAGGRSAEGPGRAPRLCQGADPAPGPAPSCWEPQPSRTDSRTASATPSSVSSRGTSKCGYSQGISKVGPPGRREKGDGWESAPHLPGQATALLSHLSGLGIAPRVKPGREERARLMLGSPRHLRRAGWPCAEAS